MACNDTGAIREYGSAAVEPGVWLYRVWLLSVWQEAARRGPVGLWLGTDDPSVCRLEPPPAYHPRRHLHNPALLRQNLTEAGYRHDSSRFGLYPHLPELRTVEDRAGSESERKPVAALVYGLRGVWE